MIRVLYVETPAAPDGCLVEAISNQEDMELVGPFRSIAQAAGYFSRTDLVLARASLVLKDSRSWARSHADQDPCFQVVALGHAETNAEILRLLEAGAQGFVRDTDPVEENLKNLRAVHQHKALLAPDLSWAMARRLAELAGWMEEFRAIQGGISNLTRREREILILIGRDYTNQDIANHLIIEVGTVKNHVHNILAKLKVNNRREAANYMQLLPDPARLMARFY